jgi:hypothetical protein
VKKAKAKSGLSVEKVSNHAVPTEDESLEYTFLLPLEVTPQTIFPPTNLFISFKQ